MPRKSHLRLMFTSRWIRWALFRQICKWIPALGRGLNFPLKTSFVGDFAQSVIEDEVQELAFAPEDLETAQRILLPAMINDAGETSTYPTGRTPLRSVLYRVDHCIVTGNTMMVIDESGSSVLKLWPGDANWNEAKPAILKRRKAPPGPFYTVTSNCHFYHFFDSDVIPLLYFLRKYGAEIGPMTIVTKSSYPPYVDHTLRAICSTYQNIDILEIDRTERLMDVSALWLARYPHSLEWMPVTRDEANDLGQLLSAYYQLPPSAAPDRLLFVSRGDARLRRLVNEAELMAELLDYDFEFFLPKSNDHKSQIEAFRSARIIISVHGAGLTNLLFCQPGALVIELFASNHIKSTYCWLATRLGLRYRAVVGFSGDYMQAFSVKIPLVIAEVEAELENNDRTAIP